MKKNVVLFGSTQRAVLQNSCSTVGILLGKLIHFLMSSWQDEIQLLGDYLKISLLNSHYRREAATILLEP